MGARQPVVTSPSIYYPYAHPHAPYHDPALASLAYRPLQLPLQHHLSAAAAEHHHHPQQQLSLAAAASGFQQQHVQQIPTFCHHQQLRQQIPIRIRHQARQERAMASAYQGMTDEELAELQKQSNEYEPEVTVRFALTSCLQPCLSDVASLLAGSF
jgi:hypothetical protein